LNAATRIGSIEGIEGVLPVVGVEEFVASEPVFLGRAIPLSHTNFFPDLTHVNFVFEIVLVAPAFVQAVPALTAA
jgi:hypothetical protein